MNSFPVAILLAIALISPGKANADLVWKDQSLMTIDPQSGRMSYVKYIGTLVQRDRAKILGGNLAVFDGNALMTVDPANGTMKRVKHIGEPVYADDVSQ